MAMARFNPVGRAVGAFKGNLKCFVNSYHGGTPNRTPRARVLQTPKPTSPPLTMNLRKAIANQTNVSLSLAEHVISAEAKDKNFVFSPLSINVMLSLITAGSDGPTRDQLLGYLKSKSNEELNSLSSHLVSLIMADGKPLGGPRLSSANGVWIDQSLNLKRGFRDIVENTYKAAAAHVDFQTKAAEVTKVVNKWAEKKTNGLIKEILPSGSVDSLTRFIFANAIYFKGAWNEKFDASLTEEDDFFLLNGTSIKAPFMTSKKKQYIRAFEGFKVLHLPYNKGKDNRQFSMYFFLPDAKEGLPSLLQKFGSENEFIERHLPDQKVKVGEFRIPKFKINFGFEASGVLKTQGLVLPFSNIGGLSEMVDSLADGRDLYVSNVFHESFIEVNEEGTEAAAVTAFGLTGSCLMREHPIDFVADHPFLFVIREDKTGVVLFVGQVVNPLAG